MNILVPRPLSVRANWSPCSVLVHFMRLQLHCEHFCFSSEYLNHWRGLWYGGFHVCLSWDLRANRLLQEQTLTAVLCQRQTPETFHVRWFKCVSNRLISAEQRLTTEQLHHLESQSEANPQRPRLQSESVFLSQESHADLPLWTMAAWLDTVPLHQYKTDLCKCKCLYLHSRSYSVCLRTWNKQEKKNTNVILLRNTN